MAKLVRDEPSKPMSFATERMTRRRFEGSAGVPMTDGNTRSWSSHTAARRSLPVKRDVLLRRSEGEAPARPGDRGSPLGHDHASTRCEGPRKGPSQTFYQDFLWFARGSHPSVSRGSCPWLAPSAGLFENLARPASASEGRPRPSFNELLLLAAASAGVDVPPPPEPFRTVVGARAARSAMPRCP